MAQKSKNPKEISLSRGFANSDEKATYFFFFLAAFFFFFAIAISFVTATRPPFIYDVTAKASARNNYFDFFSLSRAMIFSVQGGYGQTTVVVFCTQ